MAWILFVARFDSGLEKFHAFTDTLVIDSETIFSTIVLAEGFVQLSPFHRVYRSSGVVVSRSSFEVKPTDVLNARGKSDRR